LTETFQGRLAVLRKGKLLQESTTLHKHTNSSRREDQELFSKKEKKEDQESDHFRQKFLKKI